MAERQTPRKMNLQEDNFKRRHLHKKPTYQTYRKTKCSASLAIKLDLSLAQLSPNLFLNIMLQIIVKTKLWNIKD